MDYPLPGSHEVYRARMDGRERAKRIAMIDCAFKQIRDCCKIDVRMRANINAATDVELRRTHLVDEDKRADHGPCFGWKGPPYLEVTEVMGDRCDRLQHHSSPGARALIASA